MDNLTPWMLYLYTRTTPFIVWSVILCVTGLISIIVALIFWGATTYGDTKQADSNATIARRLFRTAILCIIVGSLGTMCVPSKRDMAIMFVVPLIAHSESLATITGDGAELYQLGIKSLKEWLTNGKEQNK